MVNIGKYNTLKVIKEVDFGVYLDGEQEGEILMPIRYVPKNCQPGDMVDAFPHCNDRKTVCAGWGVFDDEGKIGQQDRYLFGLGHYERPFGPIP